MKLQLNSNILRSRLGWSIATILLTGVGAWSSSVQFGVEEKVKKTIGDTLKDEPYHIDSSSAFPDVGNRAPEFNADKVHEVKSMDELKAPLTPGDYAVPVLAYGMMFGMHQPGDGQIYSLGRLDGKLAASISNFAVRSTLRDETPEQVNAIIWRIIAGIKLKDMSKEDQILIHLRAPELEEGLANDYLEPIHKVYSQNRAYLSGQSATDLVFGKGVKPIEEILDDTDKFGEDGHYVANLYRARKPLAGLTESRHGSTGGRDLNLPGTLYKLLGGDGSLALDKVSDGSAPWAELQSGVFVRLAVYEGVWKTNWLEVHVSAKSPLYLFAPAPDADAANLGDLLGLGSLEKADDSAPTALIGYASKDSATPLLLVPHFGKSAN